MSSKQDKEFEKKMTEDVEKVENVDDLGIIINIKPEPIQFPNETWEEIIMWCKRLELGEHVSLTNDRLFCITYPFMHVEKVHQMAEIYIYGGDYGAWLEIQQSDGTSKAISKSEVPSVEITDNITAGNLNILGIDKDVLNYVRLLAPIHSAIRVYLNVESDEKLTSAEMKELLGMFADKTKGIILGLYTSFSKFHENYSNVMKNLVHICTVMQVDEQNSNLMKNWLYQMDEEGKPKVLEIVCNSINREFLESIKEDFKAANKSSSFLISIADFDGEDLSCNLVNPVTEERLIVQLIHMNYWLIARLPKNWEDSQHKLYMDLCSSIDCLPRMYVRL